MCALLQEMTTKCELFEQADVTLKARLEERSVSYVTKVQIGIAGLLHN